MIIKCILVFGMDNLGYEVTPSAQLINRNAASGFSFGLIEVALYGLDDGGLVIQPRTIAKTEIIERTVVLVRDQTQPGPTLIEEDLLTEVQGVGAEGKLVRNELGESPKQAEYRAWWTPVLETKFDDPDQEPPKLFYPNNVRVALPIPKTWILAYRFGGDKGQVGVSLAGSNPSYREMIEILTPSQDQILAELPVGSMFRKSTSGDDYTFSTARPAADFANEDEKRQWIAETLNTYVNVIRPKLKD
jgi:hypothetical protein